MNASTHATGPTAPPSAPREIKVRVQLTNGRLISKANIPFLRATSDRLCTGYIGGDIDPKTYRETWIVKKSAKGYIFQEITHGGGICGFHPTLRRLVQTTLMSTHIRVSLVSEAHPLAGQPYEEWEQRQARRHGEKFTGRKAA